MKISIIAAVSQNNVIGIKNSLPWKLPADMMHFKQITLEKPVIMGEKTFESIGKPLPRRTNIVISINKDYNAPGCIVVHSIQEAIEAAEKENKEIMIIGGASIYKQFLPLTDKIYLTLIHADFDGDAFFPEYNLKDWKEIERIDNPADEKNPFPYSFVILEKK